MNEDGAKNCEEHAVMRRTGVFYHHVIMKDLTPPMFVTPPMLTPPMFHDPADVPGRKTRVDRDSHRPGSDIAEYDVGGDTGGGVER